MSLDLWRKKKQSKTQIIAGCGRCGREFCHDCPTVMTGNLISVVSELHAELMPHMMKEEQMLFPIIRKLEASTARPEFHCGSVSNPIRQMEHEHDHAGDALKRLRELSSDFTPPDWACNTYRAMIDGLRELEENMHQHVHKENNVLFVKAAELEASLSTQAVVGTRESTT